MQNFDFLKLNNCYTFDEESHIYYWNNKPVTTSVTQFISRYFKEFDTEGISAIYAKKHNLLQEDVKREWKAAGDISAMAGTIIHAMLEHNAKHTEYIEDYSKAQQANLEEPVRERVKILKPKVETFIADMKDLLIPIATEYTVGLEDKLAGNIDLLAWNNTDKEIQIWDYKNIKQMSKSNGYNKCYRPFEDQPDCNFVHYSMQLSFYKAMAQRLLGIKIGKLNLVHFNYTVKKNTYTLYEALDFTDICDKELDKLLMPTIKYTADKITSNYTQGIFSTVPF